MYSDVGYLLHYRAYRDTSIIADVFSRHHGRVSMVARGVRTQHSVTKGLLQPFVPLYISWVGRSELMTLTKVEPEGTHHFLKGDYLLSALYMNELLVRLLARADAHTELYDHYVNTLTKFTQTSHLQRTLRLFEKHLLQAVGYAISLQYDTQTGLPVKPEKQYLFDPQLGIIEQEKIDPKQKDIFFTGESLLSLAKNELHTTPHLHAAKRLMRLAFAPLLGHKPLKSRELFL